MNGARKGKNNRNISEVLFLFLSFFGPVHFFIQHDFQDGFVRLNHAVVAEGSHVLHCLSSGIADNAIGVFHVDSLQ